MVELAAKPAFVHLWVWPKDFYRIMSESLPCLSESTETKFLVPFCQVLPTLIALYSTVPSPLSSFNPSQAVIFA